MPELPEVETVVRSLRPHIVGRRILKAEFRSRFVTPGDRKGFAKRLVGLALTSVERRGKFIWIQLDSGASLAIHLGMTGRLLFDGDDGAHTRAMFWFADGTQLAYDDIRHFGRIEWCARGVPERIRELGPDPLATTEAEFVERLRSRKRQIKPLLLDQGYLAGLGNIYVDETLFRAGIDPRANASRLSRARAAGLHRAIVVVLSQAIEHRGSSISDYVDAEGQRGGFQLLHQVYGRAGKPCAACGRPIQRILVAQRGTHFCPACQRR